MAPGALTGLTAKFKSIFKKKGKKDVQEADKAETSGAVAAASGDGDTTKQEEPVTTGTDPAAPAAVTTPPGVDTIEPAPKADVPVATEGTTATETKPAGDA